MSEKLDSFAQLKDIFIRPSGRDADQMRDIKITRNYTKHAEGSVLVEFGDTKVLCNASVTAGVPGFLRGSGNGWLTAEYGMLPRATDRRTDREAARGKQQGRTIEISRLIGRSLRAGVDLTMLGENTITVDCDVLQADGGTRTASITGAAVALYDAIEHLRENKKIKAKCQPIKDLIGAVSVGVYKGKAVLDLDYPEDSNAESDVNVIMTASGGFIEVQGTAEGEPFSQEHLLEMLELAKKGIADIAKVQKEALGLN